MGQHKAVIDKPQYNSAGQLYSAIASDFELLPIFAVFTVCEAVALCLAIFLHRRGCRPEGVDKPTRGEQFTYVISTPVWLGWIASLFVVGSAGLTNWNHNNLLLVALVSYAFVSCMLLIALRLVRADDELCPHLHQQQQQQGGECGSFQDSTACGVLSGPITSIVFIIDMALNYYIIQPRRMAYRQKHKRKISNNGNSNTSGIPEQHASIGAESPIPEIPAPPSG